MDEVRKNMNRPIWEVASINRFVIVGILSLEGEIVGYNAREEDCLSVNYYNINTLDVNGCDHWDWTLKGAIDKKIVKLNEEIKSLQRWKSRNNE